MISIITPSYGQLDLLKLCIASVADQVGTRCKSANVKSGKVGMADSEDEGEDGTQSVISNLQSPARSALAIEHIIQDGGTPGIADFAREVGAELKSRYGGDFISHLQTFELLHFRSASGYTLRVFKEPDAGMYDALNKGIARISGDLWAWINSDEQYLPGTIRYVAQWFEEHARTEILCGDALLTDMDGNALAYRRSIPPLALHTRLVHLGTLSCASFYRKGILSKAGCFDTRWRSIGDAEWMERLLKSGAVVESCQRPLATFTFTGRNTSESPLAKKEEKAWRQGPDAPPSWMRMPVIMRHRIRKLFAGAYSRRSLSYAIHRVGGSRSIFHASRIGWNWPSRGSVVAPSPSPIEFPQRIQKADCTKILGTPLMETTYDQLSSMLINHNSMEEGAIALDFANTQIVTMCRHDAIFNKLSACIDVSVPDGMPLVWAMNRKGACLIDRVYGPTFTREFLASCPEEKTHYLVGGSRECGQRFMERMLKLNPSLKFIGSTHGNCTGEGVLEDDEEVLREIQEKRPDFIWVGLGTPKQYAWIHRVKPLVDHGVFLAVGFAFDVNAGMKSDAPLWMQRIGMTWVYRMLSEPRRLMGRYLKWNTLFLYYIFLDTAAPHWKQLKLMVRNNFMKVVDLFASEIRDHVSGESLGRGLLLGWGGSANLIGHSGLPPLIPRFLPQGRLTYWKQPIGFTTHPRPDYQRLGTTPVTDNQSVRVINVVLTHFHDNEALRELLGNWKEVCRTEDLWIAFGGTSHAFERLDYPRKVFIQDSSLRVDDNQRERQSYTGIFRAMSEIVENEKPDFVYLIEYDHVPLASDLNRLQVKAITNEKADVMGHWLYRVDGTSNHHMLYHETDPAFLPFWKSLSRRDETGVVLSMLGTGSFWRREAFLAIAKCPQEISCYLELYLPTLTHHLGFRVRAWNDQEHLISNLPSRLVSVESGRERGCWTVHPIKNPKK